MALTRADGNPTSHDLSFILLHRDPKWFGVTDEDSYVERLAGMYETLDDPSDADMAAINELRSDGIISFNHDEVCAALGITKTCCKVSLLDPPIIPVYSATRPVGTKIIHDTGLRKRIVTRRQGESRYYTNNYSKDHEKMIRELFPADAPRFTTDAGSSVFDDKTLENLNEEINNLPDDL